MADTPVILSGDIVIDEHAVRFSGNVGRYATNEQRAVLYQTAENLRKVAVNDRYPSDPFSARMLESDYGNDADRGMGRNEHGVPIESIIASLDSQLKDRGEI